MHVRHPLFTAILSIGVVTSVLDEAAAVNVVPNDSFESISGCPTGFGQTFLAAPWDTPNTGTSDVYNTCVTGWPPFPVPGVPLSPFGFQNPRTGIGMAGIIPYSSAADYREYITAPLTSTLAPGNYLVSFYVNLADTAGLALDRIGAYFSVGPVGPVPNYAPLPYTPQVESPANVFLTDKVNWMQISGTFTAAGGENWITIGSFHDDANTNLTPVVGDWPGGTYYFIDDVAVEVAPPPTDQACCLPDGSCAIMLPGECQAANGTTVPNVTTCTPSPCNPTASRRRSWGEIKTIYR